MRNKLLFFLVLALVIIGAIFLTPAKSFFFSTKSEMKNKWTEQQVDIDLKGINTPDTNLKNLKGKMVFLNFWATWCTYCKEEMPSIQKLYDKNKDRTDVAFAMVVINDKEEEVRKYIAEGKYTFPVYMVNSPIDSRLIPKLYPTTYIFDSNFNVLNYKEEAADWSNYKL